MSILAEKQKMLDIVRKRLERADRQRVGQDRLRHKLAELAVLARRMARSRALAHVFAREAKKRRVPRTRRGGPAHLQLMRFFNVDSVGPNNKRHSDAIAGCIVQGKRSEGIRKLMMSAGPTLILRRARRRLLPRSRA